MPVVGIKTATSIIGLGIRKRDDARCIPSDFEIGPGVSCKVGAEIDRKNWGIICIGIVEQQRIAGWANVAAARSPCYVVGIELGVIRGDGAYGHVRQIFRILRIAVCSRQLRGPAFGGRFGRRRRVVSERRIEVDRVRIANRKRAIGEFRSGVIVQRDGYGH